MQKFTAQQIYSHATDEGDNEPQVDQLISEAIKMGLIKVLVADFEMSSNRVGGDFFISQIDKVLECKNNGLQVLTAYGAESGLSDVTGVLVVAYFDNHVEICR